MAGGDPEEESKTPVDESEFNSGVVCLGKSLE
jgi:hypothetical protein